MKLELDQAAKDFLIDKGYNPDFGARPLRRALGTYIEDPLAENLLSGSFGAGQTVAVTRREGEEHLRFEARETPAAESDGEGGNGDGGEGSPKPEPSASAG